MNKTNPSIYLTYFLTYKGGKYRQTQSTYRVAMTEQWKIKTKS